MLQNPNFSRLRPGLAGIVYNAPPDLLTDGEGLAAPAKKLGTTLVLFRSWRLWFPNRRQVKISRGGSSSKIMRVGIAPSAPSSPSTFSPFSETGKIRTSYRPTPYISNLSLVGLPTL